MEFVNNSASWGGGISVRSASVGIDTDIIRLFNTRCFLQYEIENTAAHLRPSEWNVSRYYIQLVVGEQTIFKWVWLSSFDFLLSIGYACFQGQHGKQGWSSYLRHRRGTLHLRAKPQREYLHTHEQLYQIDF